MAIFPQIRFDKITMNGGGNPIIVSDPHIDIADGPFGLREGIFTNTSDFYDLTVDVSCFEIGSSLGPSGWLKGIEYLKYIKLAFFVSFYKNDDEMGIPQNYSTSTLLDETGDKRQIASLLIYDALGLTSTMYNSVTKPEQYDIIDLGSKISRKEDYLKYQDEFGNYSIPLTINLKFPKNTDHLQLFVVPFLDIENLALDNNIDLTGIASIPDFLEEPYYYTFSVKDNDIISDNNIVINNVAVNDMQKISLEIPKDAILPTLNLDSDKVFNSSAISRLYFTKNSNNQNILFFFIDKKQLLTKNSVFANSFIDSIDFPNSINSIIEKSAFNVSIVKKTGVQTSKITKLGNTVESIKEYDDNFEILKITKRNIIKDFFRNCDLYYFIDKQNKEYNVVNSYSLKITIKDELLVKLLEEYNKINSNLQLLKIYSNILKLPYVEKKTFNSINPHVDLEDSESDSVTNSYGFYDLVSNRVKNLQEFNNEIMKLNSFGSYKDMFYTSLSSRTPSKAFADKLESELRSTLTYLKSLFKLNIMVESFKISNLVSAETASIDSITSTINLYQDIINNIGDVLTNFGILNSINNQTTAKKSKILSEFIFDFANDNNINNFFNNHLMNDFSPLSFDNSPYPSATRVDIRENINNLFAKKVKIYGKDLTFTEENKLNTDSARLLGFFYDSLRKQEVSTQNYTLGNKDVKASEYVSSATLLASLNDCTVISYINGKQKDSNDLIKQITPQSLSLVQNNLNIEQNQESNVKIDVSSIKLTEQQSVTTSLQNQNVKIQNLGSNKLTVDKLETNVSVLDDNISPNLTLQPLASLNLKQLKPTSPVIFDKIESDGSNSIDNLLTQIFITDTLNTNENSITAILPKFKIQTLNGFENGNLSRPLWKDYTGGFVDNNTLVFARLVAFTPVVSIQQTSGTPQNTTTARFQFNPETNIITKKEKIIDSIIDKLDFSNKYFIIGN